MTADEFTVQLTRDVPGALREAVARLAWRYGGAHGADKIQHAMPVPWGDSGATLRLTLGDGTSLAARRYTGLQAGRDAGTAAYRLMQLDASGVRVPSPARAIVTTGEAWLFTPWIDGPTGAAALDAESSTIDLAKAMGGLARAISGVDSAGLRPDTAWADPARLAITMRQALETLTDELTTSERSTLRGDLAIAISGWVQGGPRWHVGMAHGDFAPINVLRPDDGPPVLLDVDDLCLAPRLLDPAWWGWVVRYHHPAAWTIGWPDLLESAGLVAADRSGPNRGGSGGNGVAVEDALLTSVGRLRCLEQTASAAGPDARARWLDRLRVSAHW